MPPSHAAQMRKSGESIAEDAIVFISAQPCGRKKNMLTRSFKLSTSNTILFVAMLPIAFVVGCGLFPRGCFDTTAPTVISTNPAYAATDVAINQRISVAFSEHMNGQSLGVAFKVTGPGTTPVAGTVTYNVTNDTATFTPEKNLAINTQYSAMLTTQAHDLNNNSLASKFIWIFTTGVTADTTAPTVASTNPPDGATSVGINSAITATFSESMNASTVGAAFTSTGPGSNSVAGTVDYDAPSNTATFTPTGNLAINTSYTATISTDAQDLAGNALADDFVWSFTTGGAPDTIAPSVSSTTPADTTTGVATNQTIAATFSEDMNASTIDAAFTLTGPGATNVLGTVNYDAPSHIATFSPSVFLAINTLYTATITTGAQDIAGNALAGDFTWSFTTGVAPDVIAPSVSFTTPADAATGVTINTTIAATFTEAMEPSSITTANMTLTGPGVTPITGTVTYASNIATFTPTSDLAASTTFTATITTDVEDLTGNALANDFTWSFTTGVASDTTAPSVDFTTPADAATGVTINTAIAATFSEAMEPSTITTSHMTLTGPGATSVTGTVAYANNIATFTPTANLSVGTAYTATITTAVQDAAGNGMASDFTWSFTTNTSSDLTAPSIVSTNPANVAVGVPINKSINATFNEVLDPVTISTAHYSVTGPGATSIAGTVTYDASSKIATFTPSNNLAPNSIFVVTITTGVLDLAGNALASDFVWSFTTGTTLVEAPVNLGSLSNFAVVAGAGLTNYNTFGQTRINGDVGLNPTAACLDDGTPCADLPPLINGTIYANDPDGVSAAANADLTLATMTSRDDHQEQWLTP